MLLFDGKFVFTDDVLCFEIASAEGILISMYLPQDCSSYKNS